MLLDLNHPVLPYLPSKYKEAARTASLCNAIIISLTNSANEMRDATLRFVDHKKIMNGVYT